MKDRCLIAQAVGESTKWSPSGESSLPNRDGLATGGWAHAVCVSIWQEAKASLREEKRKQMA